MNSFDVKLEKANAIKRYRNLQNLTILFRLVEFIVFLTMITKISSNMLPFAYKFSQFSGEYFQELYVSVFSPRFVFIVGNVIVVVLFIKSGQLSVSGGSENSYTGNTKTDFYDEYIKSCHRSESIVHEEKKMLRSRSENMIVREKHEETRRELRRSATEGRSRRIKSFDNEEKKNDGGYEEDELSGEEFRRTVEAFIARQQKSLRDEEFAPIVYIGP